MTLTRARGALLGLAVGDAVGTTLEFQPRGTFQPITNMEGGGPFDLMPGQWTDDTSMALCLGESLLACCGFDPVDQLRRYTRWWEEGHWSSVGYCFDIGRTVTMALLEFQLTGNGFAGPTHAHSAGNGSIMRLAPVVLYYHPDFEAAEHFAAESSRTTHGAAEAVAACRILARILLAALEGKSKAEVLAAAAPAEWMSERLREIAEGAYRGKPEGKILGSGYVVDSLEAALWTFARTHTYRDAVLAAANLGDDADTTAAVCGQVAGAFYGVDEIPAEWLELLALREEIDEMAVRLFEAG